MDEALHRRSGAQRPIEVAPEILFVLSGWVARGSGLRGLDLMQVDSLAELVRVASRLGLPAPGEQA